MRSARASDGEGVAAGRRTCGRVGEVSCAVAGRGGGKTNGGEPRRREVVAGRGSANGAWVRRSFREESRPGTGQSAAARR